MRKIVSVVMVALLTLAFVSACGNKENPPAQNDSATPSQQNRTPALESQSPSSVDTSDFIGVDAAKESALQRAGLTSEEVVFVKAELDNDDGMWQYDIEFRKDRTEYDVDVKADDGSILSYDVDFDD